QSLQNVYRVFFMRKLFNLMPYCAIGNILDVVVLFGCIVTGLGAFLEHPMKAGGKSGGTYEPRRFLIKSVVVQDAQDFGLNIGHPVERISEQAARTGI